MKTIIIGALILFSMMLTACVQTKPNSETLYVYTNDDYLSESKRVDYLGYGLGGEGFGGYSMGGYGLVGYGGQMP